MVESEKISPESKDVSDDRVDHKSSLSSDQSGINWISHRY